MEGLQSFARALLFWSFATSCAATRPTSGTATSDLSIVQPEKVARQSVRCSREVTEVESLHAFAKLYGYVRFFHPSREAAAIEWNAFAVAGASAVAGVRDCTELVRRLEALFLPLAPKLEIYLEGQQPPRVAYEGTKRQPAGGVLAWQHRGFGVYRTQQFYSTRTGRYAQPLGDAEFAAARLILDAAPLRGKTIRLRAQSKMVPYFAEDTAALWLRVDLEGGGVGFFDNMEDRPVTSGNWQQYEIRGVVDLDAVNVVLGALCIGAGQAWFDDFTLEVQQTNGEWLDHPLPNAGFEESSTLRTWLTPGKLAPTGFRYSIDHDGAAEGRRSLRMRREFAMISISHAFGETVRLGEVVDRGLGAGLRGRFPLALPRPPELKPTPRSPARAYKPVGTGGIAVDSKAAVIIAWNVVQHFYPYRHLIDGDWHNVLDLALVDAADDATRKDAHDTLRRLIFPMQDGHAFVYGFDWLPPVTVAAALISSDTKVVVVQNAEQRTGLRRGDVLVEIDGVPTEERVAEMMSWISGTERLQRVVALDLLLRGEQGAAASLLVERRGRRVQVKAVRDVAEPLRAFDENRPISSLGDGIYYVDLDRASWPEIEAALPTLALMRGVVFDLRGYPNGNRKILEHLLTAPEHDRWMRTAKILRPDQEQIAGWFEHGWDLVPATPHISGEVAFITDARAMSQAESVMGYVEALHLGEIVGQPTAGTNGDLSQFPVPGGFRIAFTGLEVLKHDGSTHHGVGVLPTIPVQPTVAGIRAGRDELLERAVAAVRKAAAR